jgi:hypothetical protein
MADTVTTEGRERLIGVRQRQRRSVACIPDEFFERVRWQDPPPDEPATVTAEDVEVFVREWADQTLTDEAKEFLDQRHTAFMEKHAERLLEALDGEYIDGFSNRVLNKRDYQPLPGLIRNIDSPINRGIGEFLVLALVADRLADDDYIDPRAESLR